ncbi:MAG: hypothetical protein KatS3mg035_0529 [Bacteroidia bacterium]|nr:MAG: hypothetical protein KatS3mg035_0529 [Bacteroidia bacterium]
MGKNKLFWFFVVISALLGAVYNVGYVHPDEHFQLLEFAGYLSGMVSSETLPWEFHHAMRPSLQPVIAYCVHQLSIFINGEHNPVLWTLLLRLFSAIFSIFVTYKFVKTFEKEFSEKFKKWFWLLSFFTWFTVFLHVRFSSEAWSENFWLLGIIYLWNAQNLFSKNVYAGIFLGLAFVCRYQLAFAILGVLLWIIFFHQNKWKTLAALTLGGGLVFILSTILDSWFYGRWVIAPYNYFYQNLVLKKVTEFGQEPWYYFFYELFKSRTFILNLFYLLTLFYFLIKYPKHLFVWTLIPFIGIHFIVSHKEWRFLFPIFGFFPYILVKFWEDLFRHWKVQYAQPILKIFFILHLFPLVVTITQYLEPHILVYEFIWKNYSVHEPIIVYFKNESIDGPCKKYLNQDPKTQCLIHQVYLKNTQIYPSYFCEGDSIVLNEKKFQRMLVVYYSFQDKRDIPKAYKRVYSFYPEWVLNYFNIGGWVNRTSFLEIYEYKNP